jgi:hypothetical protein
MSHSTPPPFCTEKVVSNLLLLSRVADTNDIYVEKVYIQYRRVTSENQDPDPYLEPFPDLQIRIQPKRSGSPAFLVRRGNTHTLH